MTARGASRALPTWTHDTNAVAVALAILATIVALGLGWALRGAVEQATVAVEEGGVSARVRAGWIVADVGGAAGFQVADPRDRLTRYGATSVDAGGSDLSLFALETTGERAGLRDGFAVLDDGPIRMGERDGYQVRYAFVVSEPGEAPVVVHGTDIYLRDGTGVMQLNYEARSDRFDAGLEAFYRFARSARTTGSGTQ